MPPLISDGFLFGAADGIWGARSRRALHNFRVADGLGDTDTWDETHKEASAIGSAASTITFVRSARGHDYEAGTRILRSAQLWRSATVKRSRKGLALMIFSRLVRPVASALAITEAASESFNADKIATAPAPPAKCAK